MEEDIGVDFEFQVSLSSQSPSESAADRLFRSGRILPLHGLELAAESSYDGGDGGSENSKGKEDEFDKRNGEMVGTSGRKSPKMATTLNGNVMKYLIKFRSEKIRSIFMLLVKSYNNILSGRRGPNYYYDQNDHNNESSGIGGQMTVDIGMIKNNEIKRCPGSVTEQNLVGMWKRGRFLLELPLSIVRYHLMDKYCECECKCCVVSFMGTCR